MVISKFNTCSGIELPGVTNNRGEERKQLLPAPVPKHFSFSLASWKTCSLRLRNLPSAFAMKFQCGESSWAGLKRWPGMRGIVHASWIHSGVRHGRKEDPTNNTFAARPCHCPELRFSFPAYDVFVYSILFQMLYPSQSSKLWVFFSPKRLHFSRNMRKVVTELYVRDNCHPFKATLLLWVQIPMWMCVSLALRNCSVGALGSAGAAPASSLTAAFYSPAASADTLLVKECNVLSLMYELI